VVINHKDEDKHNNEVSNIEWTAHSTNVKYSISKRKPMQDKFDVELIHDIYLHAYNVFGTNVLLDELTYSLNSTFNRSTSRKVYMELLRGKTYQEELQKVPTALVQKVQALFKK
ncbi:hypothetical protein ACP80I_23465, partial [Escherichia coli]